MRRKRGEIAVRTAYGVLMMVKRWCVQAPESPPGGPRGMFSEVKAVE